MEFKAPPHFSNNDNVFFDIVDVLCQRFMGLTPFEVLNTPFDEVMDLYVDCILHDMKDKKKNKDVEWVTSANATWH